MAPLVNLRHQDESTSSYNLHETTCYEVDGNGFKTYDIEITEWWIVDGVFTQNEEGEGNTDTIEGLVIVNAYFQPFQGYKPDTINTPAEACLYSWEVPMSFTAAEDYWLVIVTGISIQVIGTKVFLVVTILFTSHVVGLT